MSYSTVTGTNSILEIPNEGTSEKAPGLRRPRRRGATIASVGIADDASGSS
jgi:hypothetical protein